MEILFESSEEVVEIPLGTHQGAMDGVMAEYQAHLEEAQRQGLTAAENYYKNKIERLNGETQLSGTMSDTTFGETPFPEIKTHQAEVLNLKREVNALEKKINGGKAESGDEAILARLKRNLEREVRELQKAKHYSKPQPVFRGESKDAETVGKEISFGGRTLYEKKQQQKANEKVHQEKKINQEEKKEYLKSHPYPTVSELKKLDKLTHKK